jgi:diguanylate cyclase (GGDEF)-like protein
MRARDGVNTDMMPEPSKGMLRSFEKNYQDLLENEAFYRAIVDEQSDLVCRFNCDGYLTYANPAFLRYYQISPDELSHQTFVSLLPKTEQDQVWQTMRGLIPAKASFDLEYSAESSTGQPTLHWWNVKGVFESDHLTGFQASGHILSSNTLARIASLQYTRQINAIYTATMALLTNLDLESLISQILDAAFDAIPSGQKGALHLIARDTGQLEMRAALGYKENDPRIKKLNLKDGVSYIATSVRERRPLLIQNIGSFSETSHLEAVEDAEIIRSALVAPLILGDEVLGALSLESPLEKAFNQADLDLIASFAATVTAAIRNAQLHTEVQRQAITDPLTELYNRRGFFEIGEHEIERSHRFVRPLVAMMVDVDHFKLINDNFGHAVGDQVLQQISARIHNNVRKVDIVGRYGGDEFGILLPELDIFSAVNVAERLRKKMEEAPFIVGDEIVLATISVGVAKIMPEMPNLDALLVRADHALYLAKNGGRNRVDVG